LISQIIYNQYCKRAIVKNIRFGKNKEFFIWDFEDEHGNKHVGFTPGKVYFGSKTYLWYSLLIGYFLPPAYNINFHNVISKTCYIGVDNKGVVRTVTPMNESKQEIKPQHQGYQPKEPLNTPPPPQGGSGVPDEPEEEYDTNEETELFG
jgi:hypothetical protein